MVEDPRKDIDLVYQLMKASERLGVIGATLHDADTIGEFEEAWAERSRLHSELLGRLEVFRG